MYLKKIQKKIKFYNFEEFYCRFERVNDLLYIIIILYIQKYLRVNVSSSR